MKGRGGRKDLLTLPFERKREETNKDSVYYRPGKGKGGFREKKKERKYSSFFLRDRKGGRGAYDQSMKKKLHLRKKRKETGLKSGMGLVPSPIPSTKKEFSHEIPIPWGGGEKNVFLS